MRFAGQFGGFSPAPAKAAKGGPIDPSRVHQGTLTGGIGPVLCGTKRASCGRAIADNATRATIRIASARMFEVYLNVHIGNVKQVSD
jgi:hypothetical protein